MGSISKRMISKLRKEVIPPCIALVRQHLEHCARPRVPRTGGIFANWRVQQWAAKAAGGLEHMTQEEKLRHLV